MKNDLPDWFRFVMGEKLENISGEEINEEEILHCLFLHPQSISSYKKASLFDQGSDYYKCSK